MKVIDLLVKLANGEEMPKKISIYDYNIYDEYTIWTFNTGCYSRDIKYGERQFLFEYLTTDMLNDEVEIIEDTPKENKRIDKVSLLDVKTDYKLKNKLNEIIDKINGG